MKSVVKRLFFAGFCLLVAPLTFACWLERSVSSGEHVFVFCAQLLAPVPGMLGSYSRVAFYFGALQSCSWESSIAMGTFFSHRSATVGRFASIGAYCVLGHARIGSRVMMGSRVSIPSGKRQHFDDAGRVNQNENVFDVVTVGDCAWIGEGAIIMDEIGSGAVVAAGGVVTQAVPANTLVGGNPARCLRSLKPQTELEGS